MVGTAEFEPATDGFTEISCVPSFIRKDLDS